MPLSKFRATIINRIKIVIARADNMGTPHSDMGEAQSDFVSVGFKGQAQGNRKTSERH
jgi:hypothetical protein